MKVNKFFHNVTEKKQNKNQNKQQQKQKQNKTKTKYEQWWTDIKIVQYTILLSESFPHVPFLLLLLFYLDCINYTYYNT